MKLIKKFAVGIGAVGVTFVAGGIAAIAEERVYALMKTLLTSAASEEDEEDEEEEDSEEDEVNENEEESEEEP